MLGKWANHQFYRVASVALLVLCQGAAQEGKLPMNHEQSKNDATRTTVEHFNDAFNRHDADALAMLLTEDTVFEDTSPAPDGRRIEGKATVAEFWRQWFARNPDAQFETEEMIVSGDRAVVRWVYRTMRNGQPWHLRGVDVFTVREGKVAACCSIPPACGEANGCGYAWRT